ncbi:MAG: hypothetical protein A2Z21_02920 [Candidatus Fraserbacteria bacterium RBG_16_55_9]|uniref:Uncharacterized protein n=1 Tax=Fraserbacteria sp. (strain RBG_16_55_9) TaxID=1817864 RepID=A0A1F5UYL6_FRAXR|nr:MAG: hypothetical protein A2Z21_02920 [Candidatus Fraserbacteria bacterium RBG_16_55_9]
MPRKLWLMLSIVAMVGLVALAASPFDEWQKSKHSNRQLAIDEATFENRGATAAHCGRCHSQQGFVAWLPQLNAGNSGVLVKPDGSAADEAFLRGLGLEVAKVEPITCTACHREDNFQLRVQNDTALLPAGFAALGVGKGALCMTCHNTRNGRVKWDATELRSLSGPHEAAQADVIMGKSSYFFNDTTDNPSPHAVFTGDACVTCHLKLGEEGHAFQVSETVCANCHGPAMTAERVQEPTEHLLNQLLDQIALKALEVKDKIATVTSWDPATDGDTPNTAVDGTKITSVSEILTIHGQMSFKFNLEDGSAVYSQIRNIKDAQGQVVYALSDPIARAAWNYLLIEYDGSFGVHYPSFARDVLLTTTNALK